MNLWCGMDIRADCKMYSPVISMEWLLLLLLPLSVDALRVCRCTFACGWCSPDAGHYDYVHPKCYPTLEPFIRACDSGELVEEVQAFIAAGFDPRKDSFVLEQCSVLFGDYTRRYDAMPRPSPVPASCCRYEAGGFGRLARGTAARLHGCRRTGRGMTWWNEQAGVR